MLENVGAAGQPPPASDGTTKKLVLVAMNALIIAGLVLSYVWTRRRGARGDQASQEASGSS